jgi:hypothetical protein
MPYAFVQDVPANEQIYQEIRARLGDEAPHGLISHVAMKRPGGLRYVDVWETQADWERFRDEKVEPVVTEVLTAMGIPVDPSQVQFEAVEVVDTWIGRSAVLTPDPSV